MKLSFVNTRMPGINTFQIRDLRTLMRLGVSIDLYLFEIDSLDPAFRAEIEQSGGVVERIPFPLGGGGPIKFLGECVKRPHVVLADLAKVAKWTLQEPAEGIRALAVLPASLVLRDRLEARGTDRVHALWAGVPATVAYWVSRHSGFRFSISAHAWDLLQRTRGLREKVLASERLVVCSGFAQETARAIVGQADRDRVELVYHGLDLSEWTVADKPATRPDELEILAVGRLTWKKGFEYLIDACAKLRGQKAPVRCRIIGPDGGLQSELQARIDRLGLTGVVVLEGGQAPLDVRKAMAAADILCCPSVQSETSSDGIPNVVLEALALGTPVVTTDAGGLSEVVLDGETGLRVPQRDPEKLAEALLAAWTDWEGTRARARAGRTLIEKKFDADITARRFLGEIGLPVPQAGGREHAPILG
ncbi:MAG: glycosyltransferase family 4 protein [Candidatus Eisenbacteria bacterium]|uniref:Glycosyltransferase family 4 protein n=1 Tax=Eiseniibacteriota bacterium TaxID=2212470 RepID=A0A956NEV7_UNCEI|nr:glycosyltransferase family 4 protein [Candidatus Eisenbacteria bacterium]MCB9463830.1 glycosyltransferase family 4 protein [Candidatus Eisenbacteria bacterium]